MIVYYWIKDMGNIKVFIIVLMLLPFTSMCQIGTENGAYYKWFDKVLGEEKTGLYNGKQYVNFYVNKTLDDNHVFFHSDAVLKGSITYDNQTIMMLELNTTLKPTRF